MKLVTRRVRVVVSCLLVIWWLSLSAPALAQTFPPLDGIVSDDTGLLNVAEINQAATDLEQMGIRPLVVFSQAGTGYPSSEQLAYAAAENYGLAQPGRLLDQNLFAIVVVLDKRQTTILYGDALKPYLGNSGGQSLADDLRINYLEANLRTANYTDAFAETLRQAAIQIDLRQNPPPTPTPVPSVITNIDTEGLGNSLLIGLGVLVLLGTLAVVGPLVWRTIQRNRAATARREALREQLLQARNVAADMITDLDYPDDPNRQIQYRFLALALQDERPQQLAEITAQYEQIYDRLVPALATYNRLNLANPVTEQELNSAIAEYQHVQSEVRYASGFLAWLAEQSRSVEEQIASAPTDADAAKKALAAATEELTRLAAATPELTLPNVEGVLSPVAAKLAEAEAALVAVPPRSLAAYDAAGQASALLERTMVPWRLIATIHSRLRQEREKVASHRSSGFKLSEVDLHLTGAIEHLQSAVTALANEPDVAEEALNKANELVEAAGNSTERLILLQADNITELEELKQAGDQTRALIEEGARAFDAVDEYAEESWRDIRGNGTEAQHAADLAFNLWKEASAQNAVTTGSPQDFDAARRMIDQGNEALNRARELIGAIVSRLENLKESQRIAAEEIAAAERDIKGGLQFVERYDPDISPRPAELLVEAGRFLEAAKTEIGQKKPNWIEVVALARKANDTADRALADARSEHEAMEARRLRLKTTAQQANASLSRAANFASVHRADLSRDISMLLSAAQGKATRGEKIAATAQARGVEDIELGRALDDAVAQLAEARDDADKAFAQAETQFQAMEALRSSAYDAVSRAESAIASAETIIEQGAGVVRREAHDLLDLALAQMPRQVQPNDAPALRALVASAQQAEQYAVQAHNSAVADIEAHNRAVQARQMQDVLQTIAVLGTAVATSGGGRRRSRGGWGGGGGISIGGGGWGGGGSSSGGWGGGGSSSGGWGGGGSSGGSWGGGGSSSGGW